MKTKSLILLLILASLWGPSFLFIKIAVAEVPPITLAALRIGIAALLLFAFLYMRGGRLPKSTAFWTRVTIAGFFAHALPFVLINWGETYIASGLASILNGLTPLFTIVIAHFMLDDDKMNFRKVVGSIIGFGGLIVLIAPSLSMSMEATVLGILAVSIGAISYGFAMAYSRKYLTKAKPLHAPTAQLLVATLYLVPLSFIVDGGAELNIFALSSPVLWSILTLATFGTAVAFVIYYKIIEVASASYLSLVTYLMPVYGVILGIIFLNESLSWFAYAGAGLIIFGVMIANKTIPFEYKRTKINTSNLDTCVSK